MLHISVGQRNWIDSEEKSVIESFIAQLDAFEYYLSSQMRRNLFTYHFSSDIRVLANKGRDYTLLDLFLLNIESNSYHFSANLLKLWLYPEW